MQKKKYKHLRFEERFTIEKLYKGRVSIRIIAEFLERSPNTISLEIKKNRVHGMYEATKAESKVRQRIDDKMFFKLLLKRIVPNL